MAKVQDLQNGTYRISEFVELLPHLEYTVSVPRAGGKARVIARSGWNSSTQWDQRAVLAVIHHLLEKRPIKKYVRAALDRDMPITSREVTYKVWPLSDRHSQHPVHIRFSLGQAGGDFHYWEVIHEVERWQFARGKRPLTQIPKYSTEWKSARNKAIRSMEAAKKREEKAIAREKAKAKRQAARILRKKNENRQLKLDL